MSTIGGGKSGWRAGGDKGNQPFSMSDEQWDRIFGRPPRNCGDCADCGAPCSADDCACDRIGCDQDYDYDYAEGRYHDES